LGHGEQKAPELVCLTPMGWIHVKLEASSTTKAGGGLGVAGLWGVGGGGGGGRGEKKKRLCLGGGGGGGPEWSAPRQGDQVKKSKIHTGGGDWGGKKITPKTFRGKFLVHRN